MCVDCYISHWPGAGRGSYPCPWVRPPKHSWSGGAFLLIVFVNVHDRLPSSAKGATTCSCPLAGYSPAQALGYPLSTRREPCSRASHHCTHTGAFLPNPSETISAQIRYPTTTSAAMQSGPQALHRLGPPGACPTAAHPTTALTPVHSLIIQRRSLPRFVIQPPRLVQALDHLGPPISPPPASFSSSLSSAEDTSCSILRHPVLLHTGAQRWELNPHLPLKAICRRRGLNPGSSDL